MQPEQFQPELKLVLSLLRTAITGERVATGPGVQRKNIDWGKFLRFVSRHRVAPLVHRAAQQNLGIPPEIQQKLARRNQQNVRKALALTRELVHLNGLFEAASIPVFNFKGPLLASAFYGDVSARHAGDLDLLIEPQNVAKADALIQENDYRFDSAAAPLTEKQFATYLRLREEFIYRHKEGTFEVDIHWRLIATEGFFPLGFTEVKNNACDFEIAGATIKTLSPQYTLLYLFVHGAMHAWFRLKWVCDIAQILSQKSVVNWSNLLTSADELGVKRLVFQGALLAHSLLAIQLPAEVLEQAGRDKKLPGLLRRSRFAISESQDISSRNGLALLQKAFYMMNLKTDFRSKFVSLFWRLRTSPDDWRLLPLPDKFFYLYYLLRPGFLVLAFFKKSYFYINPNRIHEASHFRASARNYCGHGQVKRREEHFG